MNPYFSWQKRMECVCVCWPLTYRWCVGCTHNEQGTPALPWLGEHVGLGKVWHEAAVVTGSNEASLELERCRSSAGLQGEANHRHTRQTGISTLNLHAEANKTRSVHTQGSRDLEPRLQRGGVTKPSNAYNDSSAGISKLTCDGPQSSKNRGGSAHVCQKLIQVLVT